MQQGPQKCNRTLSWIRVSANNAPLHSRDPAGPQLSLILLLAVKSRPAVKQLAGLCMVALTLSTCCYFGVALANPVWAHDEPHEQLADFFYYMGPWGVVILVTITVLLAIIFLLWILNRTQFKLGMKQKRSCTFDKNSTRR